MSEMADLFTVKIMAKQIRVRFDALGDKISETVSLIPKVFHDLPHMTALAYRRTFPDSSVEIVAQEQSIGGDRRDPVTSGRRTSFEKFAPKPKIDKHAAARSGDMSAAIGGGK